MINETLNETLHDSNSLDEKNPHTKNLSEGAANNSQTQISDFTNKVQDSQQNNSSGNLLKDPQSREKTPDLTSQAEQPVKQPSIGRDSPGENNIYGTKDYFDYYTRLLPQHRDPKLPKPTYYESMGIIESTASTNQINPQAQQNDQVQRKD